VTVCYLALGSNLGDRAANLALARTELEARGAHTLRSSTVRETEPFGVRDQPLFLNQVLEVEWPGSPRELLETAKAVEAAVGRTETYRWGPREIDVDILLFDDLAVREEGLTIPHPGLAEREFVRQPLAELRPDILAE
jgi:2-amino-4-hydroxy-6-hydroxymethyldihydropteridine diphosphokinase